jgi:hypothetical protein
MRLIEFVMKGWPAMRQTARWAVASVALMLMAPSVQAAQVSGTLTGYENSAPQANRYLHFENRITGDIYLAPTARDGNFGTELPPGEYQLRAEHGAVLAAVEVGFDDIPLGVVRELAPYAPSRLWNLQSIAPAQVISAAPSTANIMTRDNSGFTASVAQTRPPSAR